MLTKAWSRTLITLTLVLAILWSYSMVVLAAQQTTGSLSVFGEVSINGTRATSGTTVFSDSTVTTAKSSSAVVSLGKLGRVEVLPESSVKLSFVGASVTGMLESGRVRVSTSSGANASIMTKDGVAVADNTQPNAFTVDVACGNTFVVTQAGRVELRSVDAGSEVKQIGAGQRDTAGQPTIGTRCVPDENAKAEIGSGTITTLLLAAGSVIAIAILLGREDDTAPPFFNVPNFSPR